MSTETSGNNSSLSNGIDPISWEEPTRNRNIDVSQRSEYLNLFLNSQVPVYERIKTFPNYIQTGYLRKFITRLEIYKKVLNVHGSIIECGVLGGDGVFAWAHFAEIFEPYNHLRKVIGFDTFDGFPNTSISDAKSELENEMLKVGGLKSTPFEELNLLVECFDLNRPLSHLPRIELIKGDAIETIPQFVNELNPELVCALLWLDFDLYEPTLQALRHIVPRMPKGAVIAFDELNHPLWPGETKAVLEEIGISNLRIERFSFGSTVSFAVLD